MPSKPDIGKVRSPRVCHIGPERGAKMTDAALKIGSHSGRVLSASDVVKFLIDNYTECAIKAMTGSSQISNLVEAG